MNQSTSLNAPQYRIGAVSRLSGIPPVTIRMWERRYEVTRPERTPAGDRLYSDDDVRRLSMLKIAVDGGHSISAAALLNNQQLQNICNNLPAAAGQPTAVAQVVMLGQYLPNKIKESPRGLNIVNRGTLTDIPTARAADERVDIVVIELETLTADSNQIVSRCRSETGARYALVVYHFGSRAMIDRLDSLSVQSIRAPVCEEQLATSCNALLNLPHALQGVPETLEKILQQPFPPTRYNSAELAEFARMSSLIKCECPQHLADLVRSLQAFETYSEQCESQNRNDAAMHQMLHLATAHARRLMEDSLQALVDYEQPTAPKNSSRS